MSLCYGKNLEGRKSSFHSAIAETSGSGVPSIKTLSHREAVLPFWARLRKQAAVPAGSLFLQLRYA